MITSQIDQGYELIRERSDAIPNTWRADVSYPTAPDLAGDIRSRIPNQAPAWQFHSGGTTLYVSRQPVTIKVMKGEELFLAENENLAIFTTGETFQEAVNEFNRELIHFWQHYKKISWDKVTGDAKRLKGIYEDFFEAVT